ncbi:MAG: endolytic transglycosylase MltG [Anaerolineae bacterium]|nr:endolytic transglycosylase MltG [Anaerolineae bacterium]MDK1080599.1 endolytic transglycosylase MltG [Anaerolineae bacterium]
MLNRINSALRYLLFVVVLGIGLSISVSYLAAQKYGSPNPRLNLIDQIKFSARTLWYGAHLTQPFNLSGAEQSFIIEQGESVSSISTRLEEGALIRNAAAFRTYLIYTGQDISIQAGEHFLSPAQSIVDIAGELQNATPDQITFVILPGWRMEEIATSLLTSGLNITPEEFLTVARYTPRFLDFLPGSVSSEGFLYPNTYILPRDTTVDTLLDEFLRNFSLHLTDDIHEGFSRQGLDDYQGVTLASIVQREAIIPDEQPQIASVFINRLNAGIKLDTDPTVQYALGYNSFQATWWTNPLSGADLQINSPYNTYIYIGLPPGPIANPSLGALRAVAFPAQTPYFYFRARCDGSGLHSFAITLEEHLQNHC